MHFSGEHFKPLDAKGRLSIPREFRDQLAKSDAPLVLTKNLDGGLTLYPAAEWAGFVKRLEEIPAGRQRNALNRLYLAPKTDVQLDKQGRIPLSRAQRKWLGLDDADRELVLVDASQVRQAPRQRACQQGKPGSCVGLFIPFR